MKTQKILFSWLVIFFCYASVVSMESDGVVPMEIDYTQMRSSINAKALKQFMIRDNAKDLQIKMGTELIKSSGLEQLFAQIPKVEETKLYVNNFQTLQEYFALVSNPFEETPVVDHQGKHMVLPYHNRLHVTDMQDISRQQITSFKFEIKHPIIKWSIDDRYIAAHCAGKGLFVYDTKNDKKFQITSFKPAFCWHPQIAHYLLVERFPDHEIDMIDVNTRVIIKTIDQLCEKPVMSMVCSPDGNNLAINYFGEVGIVNMKTHEFFLTEQKNIKLVRWSSDGKYLALKNSDGNVDTSSVILIMDIHTKEIISKKYFYRNVISFNWSADGRILIAIVDCGIKGKFDYARVFIDPWQDKITMSEEHDIHVCTHFSTLPKKDGFEHEVNLNLLNKEYGQLNHLQDPFIALSNHGRYLINAEPKCVTIRDYETEHRMQKYLRSEIPLNQALFLIALYKSACDNKKIIIDSLHMQKAFDDLPECLKVNLKKWIKEHKQSEDSSDACIIS